MFCADWGLLVTVWGKGGEGDLRDRLQAFHQPCPSLALAYHRVPSLVLSSPAPPGDFQVANAALAVSLCDAFFARREEADPWELTLPLTTPLSPAYLAGLAATRFPGRAQIIVGTGRLEEGEGEGCASAGSGPSTTAAGMSGVHCGDCRRSFVRTWQCVCPWLPLTTLSSRMHDLSTSLAVCACGFV